MSGEKVIVRTFGGIPLVLRIVESKPGIIYVTNEEQYGRWQQGEKDTLMVGIPENDVFAWDEQVERQLGFGTNKKREFNWEALRPLAYSE